MEEEKKEELVVEEEPKQEPAPVEEAKAEPQQSGGLDEISKFSLISFILAVVGLSVCAGWIIGGIACIVLGIIALARSKKNAAVKQPFKTFDKITKPVAIVDIILGAVSALVYFITFIIQVVGAIAEAIAEMGSNAAVVIPNLF